MQDRGFRVFSHSTVCHVRKLIYTAKNYFELYRAILFGWFKNVVRGLGFISISGDSLQA